MIAAEGLAEVGVAGSVVVAEIVVDGVAADYRRSWRPKPDQTGECILVLGRSSPSVLEVPGGTSAGSKRATNVVVDRSKPGSYIRNVYDSSTSDLTIAINLLTRSSGSNTAYIVIFGSTSITNLQRLSKTVAYSCRWSSGTLVNLMAAIPGASTKTWPISSPDMAKNNNKWLTSCHVLLLHSLHEHCGVVDLLLVWAPP